MQLFRLSALLALSLPTAQPLPDQAPLHRPPAAMSPDAHIQTQPAVSLSDVLGPNRALTTFSSLARRSVSTDALLADPAADPPLTVLAPGNSAFEALPRKPWEQPPGAAGSTSGDDGKGRADDNLQRLVDAHIIRAKAWGQGDKAETLAGREVWWEERDGKKMVMPDEVEVDRVASRVGNGELWILRGVLNYER
jgi:uncharacterized surface protein with fasciclin (FAS1) repeats